MTDDDAKPRYGSVYARGYNDGLRAAGVTNPYEVPFLTSKATKDERSYKSQQSLIQLIDQAASGQANKESSPVMNAKKFESKYNGLTSVAKKIYESLPIKESWTVSQIIAELARNGHRQDHTVVLRVCRELTESGLAIMSSINSRGDASFVRSKVEKPQPQKPKEETAMPEPIPASKPKSADVVAIKATAKKKGPMELLAELASKARQFAEELDNAALEIEQEFQNSEAKSEKLKQLQTLLKGIAE